jgi:ribonucleotide reductase alpha subunit
MRAKYLGITIDYSRDNNIPEQGLALLKGKGFYKLDHESSPQETFARAATCFSFGDMELAQRLYDYVSKHYFMFASPIISNAIEIDWTKHKDITELYKTDPNEAFKKATEYIKNNVTINGLPISCFISHIADTKEGLVETKTETAWLSMMGGGIGLDVNNRAPDEKSTGVMAHMRGYDADTLSMKQTATRRGSIAAYLDIDHPEIMNFIQMRNPIGGDSNKKCFNLNNAVNINNSFMGKVITGEDYELIDPKHGNTGNFLNAREVWELILKTRYETGEPYINFIDNINNQLPQHITNPNYRVSSSNLCLTGDTLVYAKLDKHEPKKITLKELVNYIDINLDHLPPIYVKSFNTNNNHIEYMEVIDGALTGRQSHVLHIQDNLNNNFIKCTPNHKIYTNNRGYVEAANLKETDSIVIGSGDNATFSNDYDVIDNYEIADVYDIKVYGNHNFFANNILVHNCNEIQEYTSPKRTAVCCLSSPNLEKYDEWINTSMLADLVTYLDNVLEYFIVKAPKQLYRAVHSARMERSIGIGAMGFHSYLQSKNISFESGGFNSASQINVNIFKEMNKQILNQSKVLGGIRGEAPDVEGTGYRGVQTQAIAPNSSSSNMIGCSPGIEPFNSNAFNSQGRTGSILIKNKYLMNVLDKYNKNTDDVWKSIILNEGSVQHLEFLTEHEKNVFKTANEINQLWVVEHAALRQQYISQSQSLNIFVDTNVTLQELSDIHIKGWEKNLKGFYYLRSKPAKRAHLNTSDDKPLNSLYIKKEYNFEECLSCQG